MKSTLLWFILASLSLLPTSSASVADEIAPPSTCTGTLSGAVQGRFTCVMIAVYGFAPGVGAVSFTPATLPAGVQSVTAAFTLPGAPTPGTLSFEDCKDCMASATTSTGTLFMAQKKPPTQGTTSLNLTSASVSFPTPEGTIYEVHGSIEAEMPHGSQTVTMHVDF